MKETNEEKRQLMAKTAELNMKKVNVENINRGIVAFTALRDQWSKMIQFFQMTRVISLTFVEKIDKKHNISKQICR